MRTCDPILDMAVSQADLEAMYRNNPAQAKRDLPVPVVSVLAKPVFLTAMTQAKPNKYRNVKVEYRGMKFDSKHELKCWQLLQGREMLGEIYDLERQVPFALEVNGINIGRFTPDFVWKERLDETVYRRCVADAKSPATRKETAYRLRKRIFEAQYGLTIREL